MPGINLLGKQGVESAACYISELKTVQENHLRGSLKFQSNLQLQWFATGFNLGKIYFPLGDPLSI